MSGRHGHGYSRREFLHMLARGVGLAAGAAIIGCQSAPPGATVAASPDASPFVPPSPSPSPQLAGLPSPPAADGLRAFETLLAQVDFGPRYPGTPGHAECRRYLVAEFAKTTHRVATQDFSEPVASIDLELTNIIAQYNPDVASRIILCAHWDTRPYADQDPNPALREEPILGANDGASGVAALLEISRVLRESNAPQGVDFVLFDGEDYGRTAATMFLGSRYFAQSILALPETRPFGILLDMVGDTDLKIYKEGFSFQRAFPVVERIWNAAGTLGYQEFFPDEVGYAVLDDHIPLNDAGIQTADVIDFRYPYWHTVADTPDKCSPRSLQVVSDVVLQTLNTYWAEQAGGVVAPGRPTSASGQSSRSWPVTISIAGS